MDLLLVLDPRKTESWHIRVLVGNHLCPYLQHHDNMVGTGVARHSILVRLHQSMQHECNTSYRVNASQTVWGSVFPSPKRAMFMLWGHISSDSVLLGMLNEIRCSASNGSNQLLPFRTQTTIISFLSVASWCNDLTRYAFLGQSPKISRFSPNSLPPKNLTILWPITLRFYEFALALIPLTK